MELKDKLEQYDIKHFSASQLNIPLNLWWFKYVKLTSEERKKIEFGVPATSGSAIHDALDLSLQNVNPNTYEYDQETIDLIFDEIGVEYVELRSENCTHLCKKMDNGNVIVNMGKANTNGKNIPISLDMDDTLNFNYNIIWHLMVYTISCSFFHCKC